MSLDAMRMVWDADIQPASLKLLALCLADAANADTGEMWPSLGTLAAKCSMSRAHVKRLVQELLDRQILQLVRSSDGGRGAGCTNVYTFNPVHLCTGYIREPGTSVNPHPVHWGAGTRFTDEPPPGSLMNPDPKGSRKGSPREPRRGASAPAADAAGGARAKNYLKVV